MKRVNKFVFESDDITALLPSSAPAAAKSSPSLRVKVSQIVDAEFGGFLWPSSHPLAWWLWIHANEIKGKRILELGAGTALPGIVAAKLGADVTLTDHPDCTNVLENCSASVKLNDLSCPVEPLEWGDLDAPLLSRVVPDIVIGADIFYNSKDLFATIRFLMERNPRLVVWTTYQNRSRHNVITFLLRKWGMKATVTELEQFYPEKHRVHLQADVLFITLTLSEPEV